MRRERWMISFHVNFVGFAKCLPFRSGVQQSARVAFLTPISPVNEAGSCMQCVKTYLTHPRKRRGLNPKIQVWWFAFFEGHMFRFYVNFRVFVCVCVLNYVLYIHTYIPTCMRPCIQIDKEVDRQADRQTIIHTHIRSPAMKGWGLLPLWEKYQNGDPCRRIFRRIVAWRTAGRCLPACL